MSEYEESEVAIVYVLPRSWTWRTEAAIFWQNIHFTLLIILSTTKKLKKMAKIFFFLEMHPFLFAGNVWIYGARNEWTKESEVKDYCHPVLYSFTFWMTTLFYIVVGAILFGYGCILGFLHFAFRERRLFHGKHFNSSKEDTVIV